MLIVHTWDVADADHSMLDPLFAKLATLMARNDFRIVRRARAFYMTDCCGALATAFIAHEVLRSPLPCNASETLNFHTKYRSVFATALADVQWCYKPWTWGLGVDAVANKLAAVLIDHGVPEPSSTSRAAAAIQVIGKEAVDTALKSRNTSKQLKTLGNQHKFQFLLPSELQQLISKNGSRAVGPSKKGTRPQKKPMANVAPTLDPAKLQIVPGTFGHKSSPLQQLSISQLGPASSGVFLALSETAVPYLRAGQPISTEPLAMLVLDHKDDVITPLAQSSETVPCLCAVNAEPILLNATMFQLGTGLVTKLSVDHAVIVDSLDVCTLKLTIFRDEVEGTWESVCQAPIRYIVAKLPVLRLCNAPNCTCAAWHNHEKLQVREAILDVWRRQFLRLGYNQCRAKDAALYTCSIRTPLCLLEPLLALSGPAGIFCEPRSSDGKDVHEDFTVIWTPKLSDTELQHLRATRPKIVGFARTGDRKGIRVRNDDAKEMHSILKPGEVFLPPGARTQFLAGPFPYGCDRGAISKALASLHWQARPLQPAKPAPGRGMLWLIQAVCDPPKSIITMSHGEVVITKYRDGQADSRDTPAQPVGDASTIALCGASKPAKIGANPVGQGEDCLQIHDPWKKSSSSLASAPLQVPNASESLKQMESRIEQAVLAKIHVPQPMEQDDTSERIAALEMGYQKLANQQSSLEQTFNDFSTHQGQQLGQMQQQLTVQNAQLHGHIESSQQQMQALFEQQMDKIRGLLCKRGHEWWWGAGLLCISWGILALMTWFVGGGCYHGTSALCSFLFGLYVLILSADMSRRLNGFCRLADRCSPTRVVAAQHTSTRCTVKCKPNLPFGSFIVFVLCFAHLLRVGEASHPGPSDTVDDQDSQFVLGCCNPSGLGGKASYVSSQMSYGDCWTFSETHLSSRAMHSFRSTLQFERSPYKYVVGGHPVAPRNNSDAVGAWKGVALLSKFPSREIPASWGPDVAKSSRALLAASFVHQRWISFGIMYGEPEGPAHPKYKQHNDALLTAIASHIGYLCTGFRVVAGDFNCTQYSIPAFSLLEQAGFRDIQDIAEDRWGIRVSNTCKQSTRKDFFYISPELQQFLASVHVRQDLWPDHAVLEASFWIASPKIPRQIWNPPREFPWPQNFEYQGPHWNDMECPVDDKFRALWSNVETSAASQLSHQAPKSSFGRGHLRTKCSASQQSCPLKKGRRGEVEPQFHGQSFQHAAWFRQVRRLQAYARHVKNRTDRSDDHSHKVWDSILSATGFRPSFSQWWLTAPFRFDPAPPWCPCQPPDAFVAKAMFDSVLAAVRQLEQTIKQSSRQYAKMRRECDPMLVFRDLKDDPKPQANLYIAPTKAVVDEVRPDENMIVTAQPVHWDPAAPLMCNGQPLQVIHAEENAVWVDPVPQVSQGDVISQVVFAPDVAHLFESFHKTWKDRWDRHRHVPESQWSAIVAFARAHLPHQRLQWDSMDIADIRSGILTKKKRSAKGLDGISIADLRAQPDSVLAQFAQMYYEAECTGQWPSAVISGRVSVLPKKEHPTCPDHYRPITILGTLYRLWGSFHSRKAIHALCEVLPGLYGSRPKCHATQVWASLLWSVEAAMDGAFGLHGLICDLQKAFNLLPRLVIMESLAIMGIPWKVLVGWSGALACMPRHFQLLGELGPAQLSTTGVPEGCALSCLAMIAIDALWHHWMSHMFPLVQPVSYADDWQLLTTDAASLPAAYRHLLAFTDAIDAKVDKDKTFVWSTSPEGRKALRDAGLDVHHHGRSLGAHIQWTRQHTNSILTDRIKATKPLWSRLRLSCSRYAYKVRAVRVSGWPRALHGVAATMIGHDQFKALRSGAMQGLSADGAGCNSALHLGLIESPATDPLCWTIFMTIRVARECGPRTAIRRAFAAAEQGTHSGPRNGVTSTLMTRLRQLGWRFSGVGHIVDDLGAFDLFQIGWAELHFRVEYAWTSTVAALVEHRQGLGHLRSCFPGHTRKFLASLNNADQAIFRKVLNGAHITQNVKKFAQRTDDDICPWCQSSDGRFHRFWICESFAAERSDLPSGMDAILVSLPESLSCFGWSLKPHTLPTWLRMMHSVPDNLLHMQLPAGLPDLLQIFTDGTCAHQAFPVYRYAAWAIVLAPVDVQLDSDPWSFHGLVPGVLQSAFRAEIHAVIAGLTLALLAARPVHLWCDCAAVVSQVRKLLHGSDIAPNSAHCDLWCRVRSLLGQLRSRNHDVSITKVSSHISQTAAKSALEEWCFHYNSLADQKASACNERDSAFQTFHAHHVRTVQAAHDISRAVQLVQLRISRKVLQLADEQKQDDDPSQDKPYVPNAVASPSWIDLPPLTSLPAGAVRWYGVRLVSMVLHWFWDIVKDATPASSTRWVSHFHLYVDFQKTMGHAGPIHDRGWHDSADRPLYDLQNKPFKVRCRWFIKLLKECLRHAAIPISYASTRPDSHMLNLHAGCFGLPYPDARLHVVDRWFRAHLHRAAGRSGSVLDSLPSALRDESLSSVSCADLPIGWCPEERAHSASTECARQ